MNSISIRLITLLLGLPQEWCNIGFWFSIRLYGPIKVLSYSRHLVGASVFYGHISFLVKPPAYEVCRGVYSFRLSVCASIHTSVNILRQSFAWSFLLFLIFLKAYPLGSLRMISVTSIWQQNDDMLLLLLIQGQGHKFRNKCDVYVKVFCEVFLLFISLTVSTYDCWCKVSITKGWIHITAQHRSISAYVSPYKC